MPKRSPMQGMRVIDFTSMMAGPFATRLLADVGAEVIKVEALTGDYMRFRSPVRDGHSSYYGQMNCGKKSIALDLKAPQGRAIARRLIARSDVLVENYRPGVMAGFGLGYAELHAEFPRLVYCSISGFGQEGSRARDPAYAPVIHAASGYDLAHLRYNAHLDRPATTGIFTADAISAIYAFGAIQSALLHRERHGEGQHLDVSLLSSMLNLLVYECQEAQFPSDDKRPLYQPVKALDGFVMVAPVNQNNFEALADAVGRPEWKQDARFCTIRAREQNWTALMQAIEGWTLDRTAADCEAVLMKAGVPCCRYRTVGEWIADEEMRGNGTFAEVTDASGRYLVPNPPFRFSDADVRARETVSAVGEDQPEVLRELGFSEAEIAELASARVIAR